MKSRFQSVCGQLAYSTRVNRQVHHHHHHHHHPGDHNLPKPVQVKSFFTRYLFAACLVFYTCENSRQDPQLTWISGFPPEAFGLGTRQVKNSFNRVISSQEWFTLQICLCWCNEHIASVAYKCNGKPWPCPVRYVKSNCPSGRRPLSQIKMEIEMQRGQS